ncbi:MAG: polysaccharide biosynthesis protein [Clostridia bacterium]|nr:polysaccharide biosynthesis protein [Clostridia bacterium]
MARKMKKNTFVEGTVIAYIAIILTKVLGAVYVIPFYKIIGEQGGVLYGYAYNVYNLFLNVSTSGIPTAVSLIVAEYNALNMFSERELANRVANRLIGLIGLVMFILMFSFAPLITRFYIGDITGGSDFRSVVMVIRVISFCLLVIPFLSVTRGYLQGNKYINPSSISQVIEQLVRIFVALVGSYIVINVLSGRTDIGVSVALAGTVLGGLVALLFLKARAFASRKDLKKDTDYPPTIPWQKIAKRILLYALPVILISASQDVYQMVDLKLVLEGMKLVGFSGAQSELIASVVITWSSKICMVINAIGIGMCASVIPFVVTDFTHKEYNGINEKVNYVINTLFYIGFPMAAFIIVFAKPVYFFFYGPSQYGATVLMVQAILSIAFSIQLVLNMMLQGMRKYKVLFANTLIGITVNAGLDIPLILLLNTIGAPCYIGSVLASIIGATTSTAIILTSMKKSYGFRYKDVFIFMKRYYGPLILSILLMVGLRFALFRGEMTSKIIVMLLLLAAGIVTVGIYLVLTYRTGALRRIAGTGKLSGLIDKITGIFKRNKNKEANAAK